MEFSDSQEPNRDAGVAQANFREGLKLCVDPAGQAGWIFTEQSVHQGKKLCAFSGGTSFA
jgi:hypothetical protein